MAPPPSPYGKNSGGVRKRSSRKWTEEEQAKLTQLLSCADSASVIWSDVARRIPGRTGKQCREKWKNDLRPDICKEPWTPCEEYTLARAHAEVGNQWSEIAKWMPGRSENSLKNHWNATLRSKADAKMKTFLWIYGHIVMEQGGTASKEAFEAASQRYLALGVHAPEPLHVLMFGSEAYLAAAGTTACALGLNPDGSSVPPKTGTRHAGGSSQLSGSLDSSRQHGGRSGAAGKPRSSGRSRQQPRRRRRASSVNASSGEEDDDELTLSSEDTDSLTYESEQSDDTEGTTAGGASTVTGGRRSSRMASGRGGTAHRASQETNSTLADEGPTQRYGSVGPANRLRASQASQEIDAATPVDDTQRYSPAGPTSGTKAEPLNSHMLDYAGVPLTLFGQHHSHHHQQAPAAAAAAFMQQDSPFGVFCGAGGLSALDDSPQLAQWEAVPSPQQPPTWEAVQLEKLMCPLPPLYPNNQSSRPSKAAAAAAAASLAQMGDATAMLSLLPPAHQMSTPQGSGGVPASLARKASSQHWPSPAAAAGLMPASQQFMPSSTGSANLYPQPQQHFFRPTDSSKMADWLQDDSGGQGGDGLQGGGLDGAGGLGGDHSGSGDPSQPLRYPFYAMPLWGSGTQQYSASPALGPYPRPRSVSSDGSFPARPEGRDGWQHEQQQHPPIRRASSSNGSLQAGPGGRDAWQQQHQQPMKRAVSSDGPLPGAPLEQDGWPPHPQPVKRAMSSDGSMASRTSAGVRSWFRPLQPKRTASSDGGLFSGEAAAATGRGRDTWQQLPQPPVKRTNSSPLPPPVSQALRFNLPAGQRRPPRAVPMGVLPGGQYVPVQGPPGWCPPRPPRPTGGSLPGGSLPVLHPPLSMFAAIGARRSECKYDPQYSIDSPERPVSAPLASHQCSTRHRDPLESLWHDDCCLHGIEDTEWCATEMQMLQDFLSDDPVLDAGRAPAHRPHAQPPQPPLAPAMPPAPAMQSPPSGAAAAGGVESPDIYCTVISSYLLDGQASLSPRDVLVADATIGGLLVTAPARGAGGDGGCSFAAAGKSDGASCSGDEGAAVGTTQGSGGGAVVQFDCRASQQANETKLETSANMSRQVSGGVVPPHLMATTAAFKPSIGRTAVAAAAALLCQGARSTTPTAPLMYPSPTTRFEQRTMPSQGPAACGTSHPHF